MALIEIFTVTASNLPIDANSLIDIPQGLLVGLGSDGNVVRADSFANVRAIGIAGDSRSTGVTSYTEGSGSALSRNPKTSLTGALINSAYGVAATFTQNHVSDGYSEVKASGKMTVYHSGGEFWTDQYELVSSGGTNVADYVPGTYLYASGSNEVIGTAGGEFDSIGGRFTDQVSVTGQIVGMVLRAPMAFPSGVPGTDTGFNSLPEGGNSLSLGTMLNLKLIV